MHFDRKFNWLATLIYVGSVLLLIGIFALITLITKAGFMSQSTNPNDVISEVLDYKITDYGEGQKYIDYKVKIINKTIYWIENVKFSFTYYKNGESVASSRQFDSHVETMLVSGESFIIEKCLIVENVDFDSITSNIFYKTDSLIESYIALIIVLFIFCLIYEAFFVFCLKNNSIVALRMNNAILILYALRTSIIPLLYKVLFGEVFSFDWVAIVICTVPLIIHYIIYSIFYSSYCPGY